MRKRDYTLTAEQVEQLEQVIERDKRSEVAQRATAIRLLHLGHSTTEVAAMFLVSGMTVRNWFMRYKADGLEGLGNRAKPGRPSKITPAYWAALEQVLATDPQSLGYLFTVWTRKRLRDHLHQITGIYVSEEQLRVQMERHGYVYRRPKPDLRTLQDAEARREAELRLADLKKKPLLVISSFSLWTKQP